MLDFSDAIDPENPTTFSSAGDRSGRLEVWRSGAGGGMLCTSLSLICRLPCLKELVLKELSPIWLLVFATFVPAAVLACLVLFPVRRWAERLGLLDRPGHRKVHTVPTPLGGGIGIWFAVVGTFGLGTAIVWACLQWPSLAAYLPPSVVDSLDGVWSRSGELWGVLFAGTVLAVLGLVDDRRGLSAWFRLAVQAGVAAAVVFGLGYSLTAFIPIPWLTKLLSVIWIVALINSFNMLDNMDALSGGVAAIVAGMLGIVMLLTPDPDSGQPQLLVAGLLFVVSGALVGFLWHNRPPAKIFMGDSGSYLVGFLVAVATLLATYAGYQESSRPHAVLAPLCVMAVPLYDMSTVLWIRIREGRSPFEGDKSHFSHRLVDLGLSKIQAVLTIHLLTLTCGLAAILLAFVTPAGSLLLVGIVLCMLTLIVILESTGWRKNDL
ncbi:WecA-like glycosyltransferase [Roseimaritima multifibrata]|uniref:WecA-like glycosyltransferase n=1 Tax=Roseimaritima multifibrata TaxID=1930274 RepID=A0A517MN09_9BACT|nr:WecA-like glycosyltransferase [Roseimaritima multifibrata]